MTTEQNVLDDLIQAIDDTNRSNDDFLKVLKEGRDQDVVLRDGTVVPSLTKRAVNAFSNSDYLMKADNLASVVDKQEARTNLDVYSKTESNFLALPLGTPIWHNGTRLTIDDGYASYDGQLLNRADFPSLWAKVQSKFVVITDAEWLANPTKRAAYSSGDGVTTFRMPDLNGFLADSIKGLHLRGDGNGTIAGETVLQSTILKDAIRDIQGTTPWKSYLGDSGGAYTNSTSVTGAFVSGTRTTGGNTLAGAAWNSVSSSTHAPMEFKASNVVPTAGENRPVSAVGIWICRVSAGTAEQVSPNTAPSLTGGNTWAGSQKVTGNLEVTGTLNANIKPLLNAQGGAPISACRAWACFNGITGTIKASLNVQSITKNATGDYTLNFISAMPHSNYFYAGGVTSSSVNTNSLFFGAYGAYQSQPVLKTTSQFRIICANTTRVDVEDMTIGVFC